MSCIYLTSSNINLTSFTCHASSNINLMSLTQILHKYWIIQAYLYNSIKLTMNSRFQGNKSTHYQNSKSRHNMLHRIHKLLHFRNKLREIWINQTSAAIGCGWATRLTFGAAMTTSWNERPLVSTACMARYAPPRLAELAMSWMYTGALNTSAATWRGITKTNDCNMMLVHCKSVKRVYATLPSSLPTPSITHLTKLVLSQKQAGLFIYVCCYLVWNHGTRYSNTTEQELHHSSTIKVSQPSRALPAWSTLLTCWAKPDFFYIFFSTLIYFTSLREQDEVYIIYIDSIGKGIIV